MVALCYVAFLCAHWTMSTLWDSQGLLHMSPSCVIKGCPSQLHSLHASFQGQIKKENLMGFVQTLTEGEFILSGLTENRC